MTIVHDIAGAEFYDGQTNFSSDVIIGYLHRCDTIWMHSDIYSHLVRINAISYVDLEKPVGTYFNKDVVVDDILRRDDGLYETKGFKAFECEFIIISREE